MGWFAVGASLFATNILREHFIGLAGSGLRRNWRWYLTGVSLFAYVFTKISVSLFASGILIRKIVGWDYMTSAILLVVATGVYTIFGGLPPDLFHMVKPASDPNYPWVGTIFGTLILGIW